MDSYYLYPLPDETFSSWIYRCSKSFDCLAISVDDVNRWLFEIGRSTDYDFDPDTLRGLSMVADKELGSDFLITKFSARSKFVLHHHNRAAFCPICLKEDVEKNVLPYWRKSWCYAYSTHCLKHGVMLCASSTKSILSKAWAAFTEDAEIVVNNPSRFSCYGWRLDASDRNSLLNSLAMRVQRWLIDMHSGPYCVIPGHNYLFKSEDAICLAKQILGTLLFISTKNRGLGTARYFFNKPPHLRLSASITYNQAMAQGVETASPYQRMIALLFLGWIFDLITDDEVGVLCSLHSDGSRSWPASREALGKLMPEFRDDREYTRFRSLFFSTPLDLLEHVRSYLSGIQSPYPQRRRSNQETFILKEYGYTIARWKLSGIKY